MNIREIEPRDIKGVVRLANLYASFDSEVSEADFQLAWSFPQGCLVAELDEQIIGFIFAYLRDIPSDVMDRWNSSKVAQIELLVVEPSYRGRGIGETLLGMLIDALKGDGVDLVLLHCPAESIEAKQLYDKFGFEVRAFHMRKKL